MKIRVHAAALLIAASLLLPCTLVHAQIRFDYDVGASMRFDNRENSGSGNMFTPSMTIFAFRVTPEIGMRAVTGDAANGYGFRGEAVHRVMVGADLTADFGSGRKAVDMLGELTMYYSLQKRLSAKCSMEMTAGIFSRNKSRAHYSDAFFSDSLRFYDPNIEGLLLTFDRPHSSYELGVDWMGQIGKGRRERFMVFAAGSAELKEWLRLGYSANLYHYANSYEVRGVVDNLLLNPWLDFDLAPFVPLERLSFTLGYLQSLQRDRINVGRFQCPQGGEFIFELRKWNLSLRNTLYYGRDLMPLYDSLDAGGFKYGSELYRGDPYYRVRPALAAADKAALYDRIDLFWEPRIAPGSHLKIAARFNFNGRYSGGSQIVALRFDLGELLASRPPRP